MTGALGVGGGRLGVALLGAGRIGTLHGGNLARLADRFRIAGVADPDANAARALADRLGADVWPSWEELVASPGVEAVLVCSATAVHADQVAFAAAAGRHVFCEKPLAEDLTGVETALAAVETAGVVLQVGFNRRFDPGFAALARAITAGELGRLVQLRITSRDPEPPPPSYPRGPGGLFTDMTIHDLDLVRFLSGDEAVSVSAFARSLVDPAAAEAGDVDVAVLVVNLSAGGFAVIENCRRSTYGYDQRAEAHGSERTAWAGNPLPNQLVVADATGARGAPLYHFFPERYAEAYVAELVAFAAACRRAAHDSAGADSTRDELPPVELEAAGERSPLVSAGGRTPLASPRPPGPATGEDARAALFLALAAQRSLESGGTPVLVGGPSEEDRGAAPRGQREGEGETS